MMVATAYFNILLILRVNYELIPLIKKKSNLIVFLVSKTNHLVFQPVLTMLNLTLLY
jgi:hypothetical protein